MQPPTRVPSDAEAFVLRHGYHATAMQTGADEFEFFVRPEGAVAYVDTGSAWVVAGAPFTDEASLPALTEAVVAEARARARRICFFGVEPRFLESMRMRAIQVAEQPEWDPRSWAALLVAQKKLREQLRRARKKGVRVRELAGAELVREPELLGRLRRVRADWLATRKMAPMGFLAGVPDVDADARRTWLVAERDGSVVAVASLLPVPARAGTLVEHVFREDDAPNGTLEVLLDAAMHSALRDRGEWLTLGMVALAGAVPLLLRLARALGSVFYSFEGIRRTRARLHPERWTPLYLAFPEGQNVLLTFLDLLRAFARGSLIAFGLRTLRHRIARLGLARRSGSAERATAGR